jgi:hypothetical protein
MSNYCPQVLSVEVITPPKYETATKRSLPKVTEDQ